MQAALLVAVIAAQYATNPHNSQYARATSFASQAFSRQENIDARLDAYGKSLVPDKELQAHISRIAVITKSIVEQRITFTWSF